MMQAEYFKGEGPGFRGQGPENKRVAHPSALLREGEVESPREIVEAIEAETTED